MSEHVGYAHVSTGEQSLDLQVDALEHKGCARIFQEVEFLSITEGIDTTTPQGTLQFQLFGALAEFERSVVLERTRAGMAAARARGRVGGRPQRLTPEQIALARVMREQGDHSMTAIAKALGVGRTTLYRSLRDDEAAPEQPSAPQRA